MHLSFRILLCALAARIVIAGTPGELANPLKPLLIPRNPTGRIVVRQSCNPGYIACSDGGCCVASDYCATVDGISGCCPIGTTCTADSSACVDPGYLQCSGDTFCCPAGDQCYRDSAGNPECTGGANSPPRTSAAAPPPMTTPHTTTAAAVTVTPTTSVVVVTPTTSVAVITATPTTTPAATTRAVTSLADSATTTSRGGGSILGGSPRTVESGAKSFFYAAAIVGLTLCFAWI